MRQQADMSTRVAGLSRDCSMTSDETDETRENEEKIKIIDAKIKEAAPTIQIIKIEVRNPWLSCPKFTKNLINPDNH